MKSYIAIIGATAAITSAAVLAVSGGLSRVEDAGEKNPAVSTQQVSVPATAVPEANDSGIIKQVAKQMSLAKIQQEKSKIKKPVITIEEIDPKDRKQSIKANVEKANVEKAKAEEPKMTGSQNKAQEMKDAELNMKRAKERKAAREKKAAEAKKKKAKKENADAMKKAEAKKSAEEDDSDDPGKIIMGSRPEPFGVKEDELDVPPPMKLINANTSLLTRIVNSKSGPSPEELHGTWEVLPCHSSVGVIAKRSFKTEGLTQGEGAYFEIVQFYSDAEKKVFGSRSETTIYVKLDPRHMLAAVNANTNLPKFSVLRKVSSEIREEPEEQEATTKSVEKKSKKTASVDETSKPKKESVATKESKKKMKADSEAKMEPDSKTKMKANSEMKKRPEAAKTGEFE